MRLKFDSKYSEILASINEDAAELDHMLDTYIIEGLTSNGIYRLNGLISDNGHRQTAVMLVDLLMKRLTKGVGDVTAPHSLEYDDGLADIESELKTKKYDKAFETAKTVALARAKEATGKIY